MIEQARDAVDFIVIIYGSFEVNTPVPTSVDTEGFRMKRDHEPSDSTMLDTCAHRPCSVVTDDRTKSSSLMLVIATCTMRLISAVATFSIEKHQLTPVKELRPHVGLHVASPILLERLQGACL